MPRVLLVEDNPDTGASVQLMLELAGHEVVWVKSGKQALKHLTPEPQADVVLTDILMPDMDGIETIQYMRKTHPTLPVIAMTGQVQAPYLRAATLFGVKATLQKPFTFEQLQGALAKALGA